MYVCARNKGLAGMELGLVLVHPGHEEPEAEEKSPAGSIRPPLASLGAKRRECGDWRPLGGKSVRPAGLGKRGGGGEDALREIIGRAPRFIGRGSTRQRIKMICELLGVEVSRNILPACLSLCAAVLKRPPGSRGRGL